MNTEDTQLHVILTGLSKATFQFRIKRIEQILKQEGFTVPPRPPAKSLQGTPGAGQEVKLTDDEILVNLITWGQVFLQHDVRAIGSVTRESIRKVFTDLVFDEIKGYDILMGLSKKRNVLQPSPPATAKKNSLSMTEVAYLWDELRARHVSLINLEIYLANTQDKALMVLLKRGIFQIVTPQITQLEDMLKTEGFTVPPRPVSRLEQGRPGELSKIKLSDDEVISVLTTAGQTAMNFHVRGYFSSIRQDVKDFFIKALSTEIEEYQKLMILAKARKTLDIPPVVTSRQG